MICDAEFFFLHNTYCINLQIYEDPEMINEVSPAGSVDSDSDFDEEDVDSCSTAVAIPRCPTNNQLLTRENKGFKYFATDVPTVGEKGVMT